MEKGQQLGLVIGLVVVGFVIMYFVSKKEPVGAEGDQKCIGADLYAYHNGQWVLKEANSLVCMFPPGPEPEPEPEPEVPEGFTIDRILANPPIVALGNSVNIEVAWFCPGSIEFWRDRELTLHCAINGEAFKHTWTYMGSTTAKLKYTPTTIGIYTATILDGDIKFNCPSSVTFEAREEVVGAFYSPYGELCSWTPSIVLACKPANTPYATLDALANEIAGSTVRKSKPAPGAGQYTEYYPCPYCPKTFTSCTRPSGLRCQPSQRLAAVYELLEHIQLAHSDHPLTSPPIEGMIQG